MVIANRKEASLFEDKRIRKERKNTSLSREATHFRFFMGDQITQKINQAICAGADL